MVVSVRSKPYIIPEYSLTSDLLAYLTCGLQYRYQNKGTLPPSMPVQLWFGNFIHGVMEEAYLKWKEEDWKDFPWEWETQIREVEVEIDKRMRSRGLYPPLNLFCSYTMETDEEKKGLCPDHHHPHKLVASLRAEKSINTWGPHLFPLIDDHEVRLKGLRDMPNYKEGLSRSNYYGVTGIVDVLSSVQLEEASSQNLIIKYLHQDPIFKEKLDNLDSDSYEIIVDYKGMNRPGVGSPAWQHHQWQVQTYAWLRSKQPEAKPVMAGILFYLNELHHFKKDLQELKKQINNKETDVLPDKEEYKLITSWKMSEDMPKLSDSYCNLRSIHIIPIQKPLIKESLDNFDKVVFSIEGNIISEIGGNGIQNSWKANPERRTCDACDFKTFCKETDLIKEITVP